MPDRTHNCLSVFVVVCGGIILVVQLLVNAIFSRHRSTLSIPRCWSSSHHWTKCNVTNTHTHTMQYEGCCCCCVEWKLSSHRCCKPVFVYSYELYLLVKWRMAFSFNKERFRRCYQKNYIVLSNTLPKQSRQGSCCIRYILIRQSPVEPWIRQNSLWQRNENKTQLNLVSEQLSTCDDWWCKVHYFSFLQ